MENDGGFTFLRMRSRKKGVIVASYFMFFLTYNDICFRFHIIIKIT